MNCISLFIAVFAVLGAVDLIIGNKLGLGKEFQKGFRFFGDLALSMIGMIVLAPIIARLILPLLTILYNFCGIDPSMLPSMIFSIDMGGASVAAEVAKNEDMALFNGIIVASMMGCTVSFTMPYALNVIDKDIQQYVLFGFLCGIVTIPIGCFVAGLVLKINIISLLINLIPLIIFAIIIAIGLITMPNLCVKILGAFACALKILIVIGLALGIIRFLTGYEVIKGLNTLESGAEICFAAAVSLTGIFPFMAIMSRLLSRPLKAFGNKIKINQASAFGIFSTLAVSMTAFEKMKDMDKKGIVLNSAFAISAAFVLADHLAFTMAFDDRYILPLIVGKITSGIMALALANIVYKFAFDSDKNTNSCLTETDKNVK
ncbi:MAG: ethanolamine utilization protein EutH [Clostridia bacterium]|nr:ethanolamine utilization protein EutH [Clostridia bacterium]